VGFAPMHLPASMQGTASAAKKSVSPPGYATLGAYLLVLAVVWEY
jgi:hypothetical protein